MSKAMTQIIMGYKAEFLETLAALPTSTTAEVRVSCLRIGRAVYVDVRLWEDNAPTKYGVWVTASDTPKLCEAIERANQICLRRMGAT